MMEEKLYYCPVCGNVIQLEKGDINHITCCGKEMKPLIANTVDASVEKHVPKYERKEDEMIVTVGEVEHPMEENHYIMWIMCVENNKVTKLNLVPEEKPEAKFAYVKGATIYAYCNLHGLWKSEVK